MTWMNEEKQVEVIVIEIEGGKAAEK